MKMRDVIGRYIGREVGVCLVNDEEFEGVVRETGEGWLLLSDEDGEYIINTDKITYISYCEEEE